MVLYSTLLRNVSPHGEPLSFQILFKYEARYFQGWLIV
jgi:hypothetical protein